MVTTVDHLVAALTLAAITGRQPPARVVLAARVAAHDPSTDPVVLDLLAAADGNWAAGLRAAVAVNPAASPATAADAAREALADLPAGHPVEWVADVMARSDIDPVERADLTRMLAGHADASDRAPALELPRHRQHQPT